MCGLKQFFILCKLRREIPNSGNWVEVMTVSISLDLPERGIVFAAPGKALSGKDSCMRFPRRRFAQKLLWLTAAGLGMQVGIDPASAQNAPALATPPANLPASVVANVDPLQDRFFPRQVPLACRCQGRARRQAASINLATALRLADARPLVIAAAQASLRQAVAELDQAKVPGS